MFSRLATLLPVAALIAVASAAPSAVPDGTCSNGGNYCCDHAFTSPIAVGGVLGAVLAQVGVNGGISCNPIAGIGVAGQACTSQVACCGNAITNGIANLQCNPVSGSI